LHLFQEAKSWGYADGSTLQWLHQNCLAFVYPSLFVGFDLPAPEAMSRGALVISSCTSSIPEIVGQARILVDSTNAAEILDARERLMKEPDTRQKLGEQSKKQTLKFSWRSFAASVLSGYIEVFSRQNNLPIPETTEL